MKRLIIYISLLASTVSAQSQYAGSFLEIPVGAKALGLGDAYVSLADDGTAFHYNPAGTALVNSKILTMMYSSQYGSILSPLSNFFFVGYTQKVQDLNLSVDWVRLSVDNIPFEPDLDWIDLSPTQREQLVKTSSNNGYFSSADDGIYLNISRMFKFDLDLGWSLFKLPVEMPIGVNFKIIHRSLYGRAGSGVGLDGGFMFRVPLTVFPSASDRGRLAFGMNVRDVTNTRIAWDTQTTEYIPRTILWGLSYDAPVDAINGHVVLAFNRDTEYGDLRYGLEYVYKNLLSIRAGLDAGDITAGAGIDLDFMQVDYAFLAQSLGNVNRVSASFYLDRIFK